MYISTRLCTHSPHCKSLFQLPIQVSKQEILKENTCTRVNTITTSIIFTLHKPRRTANSRLSNPLPPLRIISTLNLQIITSNRRLQSRIRYKLHPIDTKPTRDGLLMRRRDREVTWLFMQHKNIAVSRGLTSRRRGAEVRRRGCGRGFQDSSPVLHRGGWGVVCQKGVKDGCCATGGRAVDIYISRIRGTLRDWMRERYRSWRGDIFLSEWRW
jgi:hypothetical protein